MALMTPLKRPLPAEPPPTFAQLDCDATAACADPPEAEIAVTSTTTANMARVTRRPRAVSAPFTCFPLCCCFDRAPRTGARPEPNDHKGRLQTSFALLGAGRGMLRQNANREVNLLPLRVS